MEGKRRIGSVWSRRKKRERIAREARADRSLEAKFSRRFHRLRIDGRPGQLRTIPIASSILSNGVRKLAFHLLDLARWQLLVVGKEKKKKQATGNFIFSYPHLLVILLSVLPLIINLFSCSVLLISVSSRFAVSSPMIWTRSPKPVRKASTGRTVG